MSKHRFGTSYCSETRTWTGWSAKPSYSDSNYETVAKILMDGFETSSNSVVQV